MRKSKYDLFVPLFASCIIGAAAGLSAVLLSKGVSWLGSLRVQFSNIWPAYIVLPSFGLVGGLLAGLLVERIAPEASGSGIPQVRARLDRLVMPLNLKIAFVKLLGGTMALGSGFFMGREGPTVQLGAALAAPLSKWLQASSEHKRQLIAAGAGAGLTAAFNAPLAGITFVLEELLKECRATTILITMLACAASCAVLNLLSPAHTRSLGPMKEAVFFAPADIPFYVLLAIIAAAAGATFNWLILKSLNLNKRIKVALAIRIALAGMVSGAVIAFMPDNFHNYAEVRALIICGETNWQMSLTAFSCFLFLTLMAYGSGAPGGLFAPTLTLGSSLGYMVGLLEHDLTGVSSTAAFALVGMGALFAAVARTPLTAAVITFELTSQTELILPLLFTCIFSSAIAETISKGGLYEQLMQWNGINLESASRINVNADSGSGLCARDIMHRDVITLSSALQVSQAKAVVAGQEQQSFAVLEGSGHRLVGLIRLSDMTSTADALNDNCTIAQIMTPTVAVNIHDSLEEIAFLFSRYNYSWLPVLAHEEFAGVIYKADLIKTLFAEDQSN